MSTAGILAQRAQTIVHDPGSDTYYSADGSWESCYPALGFCLLSDGETEDYIP